MPFHKHSPIDSLLNEEADPKGILGGLLFYLCHQLFWAIIPKNVAIYLSVDSEGLGSP